MLVLTALMLLVAPAMMRPHRKIQPEVKESIALCTIAQALIANGRANGDVLLLSFAIDADSATVPGPPETKNHTTSIFSHLI